MSSGLLAGWSSLCRDRSIQVCQVKERAMKSEEDKLIEAGSRTRDEVRDEREATR